MNRKAFALVIASALVVVTTGCDEPRTKIPTGAGGAAFSRLEITGPATLAPGASAPFTVSMFLSDGSVKTAPPADILRWRTGNTFFLQVDVSGRVTAQPRMGESTLSVDVRVGTQTRTATREIVVLPDATYRLVGRITEKDSSPLQAVVNARVAVVQGTAEAISDQNGNYKLYGVPGSAVVRVTAGGYADVDHVMSLSGHATRDFQMELSGPRPALNGPYTLAIDTGPCSGSGLDPALRNRRYDAFLSQSGSAVAVELTEPRFRVNSIGRGNKFTGRASGSGFRFTLRNVSSYYYYYYFGPDDYPDVAERLADDSLLVISGSATVAWSGTAWSGAFSGTFATWGPQFPIGLPVLGGLTGCFSSTHQFVLTPR